MGFVCVGVHPSSQQLPRTSPRGPQDATLHVIPEVVERASELGGNGGSDAPHPSASSSAV